MAQIDREPGTASTGPLGMPNDTAMAPPPTSPDLQAPLAALRGRARGLLIFQRLLLVVTAVVAAAALMGFTDYLLRLPSSLRFVNLLVAVAFVGAALWRFVRPAWKFRPSLTDVALRVERAHPELQGSLASALEFSRPGVPHTSETSAALAAASVRATSGRWRASDLTSLLNGRRLARSLFLLLGASVLAIGPLFLSAPLWRIGAARQLAPWSDAKWPSRTAVMDLTTISVHPAGRALPLRAAVTRADAPLDKMDVFVRYRLIGEKGSIVTRRELLTWQERDAFADEPDAGVRGELFERLLEPDALAIEYRFETSDDQTIWRRIDLVEPPSIQSAKATITPPTYASTINGAPTTPTQLDLGNGTDDRAATPPSLAGSKVELTITLSKPSRLIGDALAPILAVDPAAQIEAPDNDRGTLRASFTLNDSVRLPLRLVDRYAIESMDEAVYRFEATPDRAPAASITEPSTDRGVLPTATVAVTAEGRDDVGLAWTSIEQRLAHPAGRPGSEPSGPGGAMEEEAPSEVVRTNADGRSTMESRAVLALTPLNLKPGDEIRLVAVAADILGASTGSREPTRSSPRTLKIISEADFVQEIRSQLSELRQAAQRIDAQQGEVRTATGERGVETSVRRGQSQITDRIARQGETLERINERVQENALNDQGLRDLLGEVNERLNEAGAASGKAATGLDAAASKRPANAEAEQRKLDSAEAAPIAESQEQVQRELANVIEMLDRGEDAWVVRNTMERLAREQKALEQQTRAAAQRTAGRNADSLTQAERAEQARIVEKQNQLEQETRQLIEQMKQREEALRQSDPTTAAGMAEAAKRAEESQVAQTMQQASAQAQQNQMTSSAQSQQQASEALEQMLQDLDSGEKKRDAVLRRTLRTIIQALDQLIKDQGAAIDALAGVEANNGAFSGLDQPMIALNTNTLGVAETARKGGAATQPLVPIITRASDAQAKAIKGLRAATVDPVVVREHENTSLDSLKQARERAQKLDKEAEDREQRQKTAELQKAYREALEKQLALRGETAPFAEVAELSRRDRVLVRKLAEPQAAIRDSLADLVKKTADLQQAKVFDFAHKRLDSFTTRAAGALEGADARLALSQEDAAIKTLKGLIEAMSDAKKKDDPFDKGQQDSGGEGNGQGEQKKKLIPPGRELKLLRALQADVLEQTAALEKTPGQTPKAAIEELANQQRAIAEVADDLLKRSQTGGDPANAFDGLKPQDAGEPGDGAGEEPAPVEPEGAQPGEPQPGPPANPYPPLIADDKPAPTAPPTPEKPAEPAPPAPQGPEKKADDLPSLDELLDLPESKPTEGGDEPAPSTEETAPAKSDLDRKLSAEETQEKFIEAVRQMGETADRISKVRDTGLTTQRLQQDILRKLDILIQQSERESQSSSSSSKGKNDKQQNQQPNSDSQQDQKKDGQSPEPQSNPANGLPNPAFKEGQRDQLNAVRAAWGGLPARIRDTFLEGMDEYYSRMYESMTESYYKKAAETAGEK